MAKKVFLHIGPPKTGTTYIQSILWHNQERLAAQGVGLPLRRRGQFFACSELLDTEFAADPRAQKWSWAKLVEAVAAIDDVALVSEEALARATPDDVARAVASLAPAEVHVVVTARDLPGLIPSVWQQNVRYRYGYPFADYVRMLSVQDHHPFWQIKEPAGVMRQWGGSVPPARISLITVPKTGDRYDLWRRFATVIGVETEDYEVTEAANTSLGAVSAEVLRRFNVALDERLPVPEPYLGVVRHGLIPDLIEVDVEPQRFGVPPELAEWVKDRAERSIAELADSGCTIVGDLDELRPTDVREGLDPGAAPEADVAVIAVAALARMAERHQQLRAELDEALTAAEQHRKKARRAERRLKKAGIDGGAADAGDGDTQRSRLRFGSA